VPKHASLVNDDARRHYLTCCFLGHLRHSVPQTIFHGMLGLTDTDLTESRRGLPSETHSRHLAEGAEVNNDDGTGQPVFGPAGALHNRQPWYTFVGGGGGQGG